jgi:hypothetical protein
MGIPAQLIAGRGRAGIALPAAMLALAMVAIIVAAAFRLGMSGGKSVAGRESAARALMLAEEGAAHAVTVLRENLAGKTSTELLVGPDNNPEGLADNGRLVWTELSSALQVPALGKATTGGSYRVHIVDDHAETDGQPFVDRNERVLVECTGTASDGSSATVTIVVRSAPTPAIAVDGNMKMSGGNMRIKGACGSVHVNGNVDHSGTSYVNGQLSLTGSITGTGLKDENGATLAAKTGVPPMEVPDLNPMDGCDSRDFKLYMSGGQGYLYRKSTNLTYNISSTEKFGWKLSSTSPVIFTLSGPSATDGSYCIDGNVVISGNPGIPANPVDMSLYVNGSVEISGNPFMKPAAGDSALIIANGDVKLPGNADASVLNAEGIIYAESQCMIDGNPRLAAQLICKNKADPTTSKNIVSENVISGDAEITFNCNSKTAGRRRVLLWSQPVS